MLRRFLLLLLLCGLACCMATPLLAAQKTDSPLLVFFINPEGIPCQMQNSILNEMSDDLAGKVLVRPVQTTVEADRKLFYAYAIRGLPTLVLTDASGKEIRRLPPGVQSADSIRQLLKLIPEG